MNQRNRLWVALTWPLLLLVASCHGEGSNAGPCPGCGTGGSPNLGTGGTGGVLAQQCDAGVSTACGDGGRVCRGWEQWCDIWSDNCVVPLQRPPYPREADFLAVVVNCVLVLPSNNDAGDSAFLYDSKANSITLQGATCELLKQQGTIRLDMTTGSDSFSPPWCATTTVHFSGGDAGLTGGN